MSKKPGAIILLSGGIDSTTCGALAKKQGYTLFGISFDYGQRHSVELQAAKRISEYLEMEQHLIFPLDMRALGSSCSLISDQPVTKNRSEEIVNVTSIPNTYVPSRNAIFLSFSIAWAEVLSVWDVFIGVTAIDYSGYPDCRPAFIEAFETMANLSTKAGIEGNHIKIHTPLIHLSKAEIIRTALSLGVDLKLTHSCYDPSVEGIACGTCDSCLIRKKGFFDAGCADPTIYSF